ncbi:MAG: type II toxin-antitoxin system RelE/ParE family toxin [Prevotellaceae bacterium]|nr:type II toxin-antitoxin system RelE/ParE family toxin [Prevotellaceae bacterium]
MNTLTANEQKKVHYIFNAFQKKTQKTPESEIQQAIKLKNEYYESNA